MTQRSAALPRPSSARTSVRRLCLLALKRLPMASPPGKKTTARGHQARQSSTSNGAGHGDAVKHKGRIKRSLASDIGADPQPIGVNTSITVISCPALKIGEAGSASR